MQEALSVDKMLAREIKLKRKKTEVTNLVEWYMPVIPAT